MKPNVTTLKKLRQKITLFLTPFPRISATTWRSPVKLQFNLLKRTYIHSTLNINPGMEENDNTPLLNGEQSTRLMEGTDFKQSTTIH